MRRAILIILLLSSVSPVWAQTADFFARVTRIKTLQAQYSQEVTANGRVVDRAAGNMTMKRPDKLFWINLSEPKQYIVADGKELYVYDPDLEQVTIKKQSEVFHNAPASLLTGNKAAIKKLFSVEGDGNRYLLMPKTRDGYSRIEIEFKGSSATPKQMVFVDELGQTTTIEFINAKLNLPVKESRFKFNIPKGVDVVR